MFPPGRARLCTNPEAIGSASMTKTMGIVLVARRAARIAAVPDRTMTSTLTWTSSATRAGSRSGFPSAQRYSIITVWPSIQPSSRRPRRYASSCRVTVVGLALKRMPTRGVLVGCAPAASGAARMLPPNIVMNARRSIRVMSPIAA